MRKHAPFFLILAGYFLVAGLFALRVPDWQAPDEPAHYNVVWQIAEGGCCPRIEMGDWNQSLLEELKANKFSYEHYGRMGQGSLPHLIDTLQYEDHQPPLYYLLLAQVYEIGHPIHDVEIDMFLLRLTSVVIGSGVVIAAYAVSLRAFAGKYGVALAAAAFVAFLPQHVHILASVNNDVLALVLVGAILWASIDYADGGRTPAWLLGLLVGAALLTKSTAYLMAGVAFLAVLIRVFPARFPLRAASSDEEAQAADADSAPAPTGVRKPGFGAILMFLIPAGALGLLWWGRNIVVYGFPDFLGLRAHDEVVVGQLRTADYIADIGAGAYLGEAVKTVVTSFYGQFGWMGVPLWSSTIGLLILLALIAVTLLGLLFAAYHPARRFVARGTWRIFGATALLSILMLIYYNTSFVQFQGRYIYSLLIPLAVTVALGLDNLRERLPLARKYSWLPAALLCLVALCDIYLLFRMIVPSLTP